jgi:hypothetical protein
MWYNKKAVDSGAPTARSGRGGSDLSGPQGRGEISFAGEISPAVLFLRC